MFPMQYFQRNMFARPTSHILLTMLSCTTFHFQGYIAELFQPFRKQFVLFKFNEDLRETVRVDSVPVDCMPRAHSDVASWRTMAAPRTIVERLSCPWVRWSAFACCAVLDPSWPLSLTSASICRDPACAERSA